MTAQDRASAYQPDLIDQIPRQPVPADVHQIWNWLFPHRAWGKVEFRSVRVLSLGGYAILVFGLVLGFGSTFLQPPLYLPIFFCAFGALLVLADLSEAKHETRIIVDMRARRLWTKSKGELQWQVSFDKVVAVQIAYLFKQFYGIGRSSAGRGSHRDACFRAYQVNIVFRDDSGALQRKTICDARTKWPGARVASAIGRLIGVVVVDHATRQEVQGRKASASCEDY